jgi:hypothetical protein
MSMRAKGGKAKLTCSFATRTVLSIASLFLIHLYQEKDESVEGVES